MEQIFTLIANDVKQSDEFLVSDFEKDESNIYQEKMAKYSWNKFPSELKIKMISELFNELKKGDTCALEVLSYQSEENWHDKNCKEVATHVMKSVVEFLQIEDSIDEETLVKLVSLFFMWNLKFPDPVQQQEVILVFVSKFPSVGMPSK